MKVLGNEDNRSSEERKPTSNEIEEEEINEHNRLDSRCKPASEIEEEEMKGSEHRKGNSKKMQR